MLDFQNLGFLYITVTNEILLMYGQKRHGKERHSLKVQSMSSHLEHCNSVCNLLPEKTKDEHLTSAVQR